MHHEPTTEEVGEIEQLYRASRFLTVQARFENFSAPEAWHSTRARIAAGRALGNLGASARARRLHLATWRRDPNDAAARYFVASDYAERHGPIEALRWLDERDGADPSAPAPAGGVADATVWSWLLRGRCLAQCRDFEAAAPWFAAGERHLPEEPWLFIERAAGLEAADRYDEAIAAAARALSLRPGYARAVWQLAKVLTLAGRDEAAFELLQRETPASQSAHLALQLGSMLSERGDFAAALAAFDLAAARFPLAEKPIADFLRARRATLLHQLGRDPDAISAARALRGRFWASFVTQLAQPPVAQRLQLPVPFVRQHHMTCAPATLAAVSAYLGSPLDHLALAAAITYDGTPDHEERHWLERHGWHVREFRVTWAAARALLQRGLPFTLVTTAVGSAHLQAVVGLDEQLRVLIIRDPYHREAHEILADELLEQQAPFGPRGMAFVPAADAARLDGLELPEAAAYDDWFQLRRALVVHDRDRAAAAAQRLEAAEPGGRLALLARGQLAYYDDNPARALGAVQARREKFPAETNLQLEELALLARLGRHAEQRARVAAIMAAGKADPAIWREQVQLWRTDGRTHRRAWRLARRHLRARPFDAAARTAFADVLWDAREFETAAKLYRLAAAAADKSEPAWRAYFAAARHTGHAAEALGLLEARRTRLGAASAQPAITLAHAFEQSDHALQAREVLAAALAARPQDPDAMVELALLTGRTGQPEAAARHLAAAQAKIPPSLWHRTAARLAAWRGDHTQALEHHEAVLAENPLDLASLTDAARLRAITTGPAATLTWLKENTARHPHFLPLRQLHLQWLRDRPAAEALAEVTAFLALEPAHAWALREQALILLRAGSTADALASARLAEEVEPTVPNSAGIVGQVLLAQADFSAARAATERALRLDIAATWLMPQLMSTGREFSERVSAAEFLRRELASQPAAATGYLQFRTVATGVLAPEDLFQALEALRHHQPDRWEPWSAGVQQAIALGRLEAARSIAQSAAEKFPLVPRAWLDLADAHRLAADDAAEEAALVRARELSPGWRDAALRLASLLQRKLQAEEAVRVLAATLAHDPLDAGLRGRLADLQWRTGRRDEAIAAIEQAAEAAPEWDEPWRLLWEWSRERGEPDRVVTFAQRVATLRAGDSAARRQLARVLTDRGDFSAALEAATAAVALAPLDYTGHDLRAHLLMQLGRRDEALAACAPAVFGDAPPYQLGAAAWVQWHFGERKSAITAMQAVAAAHPDYVWAWQQLAEWQDAVHETGRAAEAAQKYAELRPNDAVAWGWVASFKIKDRDWSAATPLLERALRLNSGYSYAAFQLLRISCEQSRWPEAERALALIRQHASPWHALRCEMTLHRWRRDRPAALRAIVELCRAPAHETEALKEAAGELVAAGWSAALETELRDALKAAGCNAEAGAIWMRARLEHRTSARPRIRWLERSSAGESVRRAAWRVYLEWLTQRKSTLILQWHVWRWGRWLAADDGNWATVGYALASFGWSRRLARWMADWRERKSCAPWMLNNLALALIVLDRKAELAAVIAAALRLPADQTRPSFVAWAARGAAMRGDYARAEQWLAHFENPRNNAFAALAAAQARAVVTVGSAAPTERRKKFAAARTALAEAGKAHARVAANRIMTRDRRRALREAATLAQSPWRWWYAVPVPPRRLGGASLALIGLGVALIALIAAANSNASFGGIAVLFLIVTALRRGSQNRR